MVKKQSEKKDNASLDTVPDFGDMDDFEEVGGFWDDMFFFEAEGDHLTGSYLRSVDNVGPNDSIVHVLSVDNIPIGIWGTVLLDNRMESIEAGDIVRIVYNGMLVNEKTGRSYRSFNVYKKKVEKPAASDSSDDIPF